MSKTTKVVLVIAGAAVTMLLLLSGGVYWWFSRNMAGWQEAGRVATEEGRIYGENRASGACVDEALRRLERQSGFSAELGHGFFLRGCLASARQPPGFCDGVPSMNDIMSSVQYAHHECAARRSSDPQACGRIVRSIQEHCHKKAP